MRTRDELLPLTPNSGVERYLDHKAQEITESSVERYETSLNFFVGYCNDNSIANLNSLTGRTIEDYRRWRREESTDTSLKRKTMRDEMYLLQDFLRYLESIEAVKTGIFKKVVIPLLRTGDGVCDVRIKGKRAKRILDYLKKFHYASLEHVFWLILGVTGRRIGGLHTLDVRDFSPNAEYPHLAFRHRPKQGTRLKNGSQSEANVNISEEVCEIIDDYLTTKRPQTVDEYGREPLLATKQGRLSTSTMRKYVYKWTRPCQVKGVCPHDRIIEDCEAARDANKASKCPSSKSSHAVRHGYISSMLNEETPKEILSERCDVSEPVIEKHYDERSEAEKQAVRKRVLEDLFGDSVTGYVS